jgi:hypothetical protein
MLEERPKLPDPDPRECREETLHLMRGGHLLLQRLQRARIATTFFEPVELNPVRTRTVKEEAQDLLEEARNRHALPAFAHRAEEPLDVRHEIECAQIPGEERQTGTPRQIVRSDLSAIDRSDSALQFVPEFATVS